MDTTLDYDPEAYLQHYGVLGMRWGVRKEKQNVKPSTKKERRKTAANRGAVVGAVAGAAGSQLAIAGARKALRSRAFNKFMVDAAVTKIMTKNNIPPELKLFVETIVSEKIIRSNLDFAALIGTPRARAFIGTGSALLSSLMAQVGGVRLQDAAEKRSEKKGD